MPLEPNNKILKADRRVRKQILAIVSILSGFGLITIHIWQKFFQDIQELAQDSPEEALTSLKIPWFAFLALVSISLIFGSIIILRLSINSFRARQFPPPGMRVIRDTRILYGAKAHQRAILGVIIAIILAICAVLLPWQGWKIYSLLEASIYGIDGI